MANQPEQNLSSKSRGTLTDSGLDLETQIFSASGRGRSFFLTSLFIELIDRCGECNSATPVGNLAMNYRQMCIDCIIKTSASEKNEALELFSILPGCAKCSKHEAVSHFREPSRTEVSDPNS